MNQRSTPTAGPVAYEPSERVPEVRPKDGAIERGQPTRSQIYDRILDDVVSLRLKPGQPVSVKEIAAEFGVSRSPVREAVIRLTDAGFVEVYPQSGTRVAPIRMDIVRRVYFVRTAIEMALVEALAREHKPRHIVLLRKIVERQAKSGSNESIEQFYRLDEQFHETIAESVGHAGLWSSVASQRQHIDRLRRLILPQPSRLREIIDEHSAIVDCIEKSDYEGARHAMADHLSQVLKIQNALKEKYREYFSP